MSIVPYRGKENKPFGSLIRAKGLGDDARGPDRGIKETTLRTRCGSKFSPRFFLLSADQYRPLIGHLYC